MTNTKDYKKQNLRNMLIKEVRDHVKKLKELGMSEKDIISLLHTEQPSLKMTISKNYRIYLGENRVEVHIEPLAKAVYLLFLNHPEGIVLKCLPDYRKELTSIYLFLKPCGLTNRTRQSIEDVTNPVLNSINEKCARIRKAFSNLLDSRTAEHYYITGKRGEAKKIALDRSLVVWE